MNLRIARKIMKAVGTPDEARYSDHQIGMADRRYRKTESSKRENAFFQELCDMYHFGMNRVEKNQEFRISPVVMPPTSHYPHSI